MLTRGTMCYVTRLCEATHRLAGAHHLLPRPCWVCCLVRSELPKEVTSKSTCVHFSQMTNIINRVSAADISLVMVDSFQASLAYEAYSSPQLSSLNSHPGALGAVDLALSLSLSLRLLDPAVAQPFHLDRMIIYTVTKHTALLGVCRDSISGLPSLVNDFNLRTHV